MNKIFLLLATWLFLHINLDCRDGWQMVDLFYRNNYFEVQALDKNNCLAIASSQTQLPYNLYHSSDAGLSWKRIDIDDVLFIDPINKVPKYEFQCIAYFKPGTFLVGCDSGYILRTTDFGNTWEVQTFDNKFSFKEFSFYDENNAVLISSDYNFLKDNHNKLFKTTDGGVSWIELTNIPQKAFMTFLSVSYPSKDYIYLYFFNKVTAVGGLLRTTNGGNTWEILQFKNLNNTKIKFIDSTFGYLYSYSYFTDSAKGLLYINSIIYTDDGGFSWKYLVSDTSKTDMRIKGFDFLNRKCGIVCGKIGLLIMSTDGIYDWKYSKYTYDKDSLLNFSCTVFLSEDVALAFSEMGHIYRYDKNNVSAGSYCSIEKSINLSPNPASEYIEINIERCPTLSKCRTSVIRIYNALGECVISTSVPINRDTSGGQIRIDISHLLAGVYFVQYVNKTAIFTKLWNN